MLHILPSASSESPLSCELRQYEVDDVPAYEALSYRWGDSNERREITCNGARHFVTASLRDALIRLRLTDEVRIVWADALCIAQSDDEEKSTQVRRMGLIYHRAKRVAVWLGHVEAEHSSKVKRVFESLRCVSGDPEDATSDWYITDEAAAFGDSPPWHALQLFFENSWFRRIWCIQEIRLSRDSVYYWGVEEYSKYVAVRLADWEIIGHPGAVAPISYIPSSTYAWRMNNRMWPDKCHLLQVLHNYRSWEATDRRDKVYGILGLPELGEESSIVPVHYEKSAAEVYYDVAVAIIKWTGDLAILAHVRHEVNYDDHSGYESWIPQWDQWFPPFRKMRGGLSAASRAYGVYKFAAPREHATQLCCRQLMVSGSIYGTVLSKSCSVGTLSNALTYVTPGDGDQTDDHPINFLIGYWREKVSPEAPVGNVLSPAMKSMARTLTTGVVFDWGLYHEASEKDRVKYLQSFLDYIKLIYAHCEHKAEHRSAEFDISRFGDGWKSYEYFAKSYSSGCAFFLTKNGSLGVGPACLRKDDIIVVIEGAHTPFALRRRGENYLLLGEVYMDEIMNGELIEEMEKEIRTAQQFCLI
jgi:hypothetical protein